MRLLALARLSASGSARRLGRFQSGNDLIDARGILTHYRFDFIRREDRRSRR